MSNRIEDKQRVYRKRQRCGMQDLRFMMMLYGIALILYTALGYYLISNLQGAPTDLLRKYVIMSITSLILWCIPIRMLWNFNRLGRIVFFLCTIGSFYIAKNIVEFHMFDVQPVLYKYMFIILFIIKCLSSLSCCLRLALSYTIRSIWSIDDMFDDELEVLEEEKQIAVEEEQIPSKWIIKAQRQMRKASIKLAIFLYSSMLLIFLSLSILKSYLPSTAESIGAIQLPLFSACLFSAMLWSIPVIALYIGKKWSPYMLYVACFGELVRLLIGFPDLINLLTLRILDTRVRILYIGIEFLRYGILLQTCRSLLRSRLLKEYQHPIKNKHDEEVSL